MPANLPPQYYEAEKAYRSAKTPQEKIDSLEAMLAIMPKHKGTEKLRADLRRRIAKLSDELERKYATARKGGGPQIRREGAGQAILVGMPNVGKSRLLAALTNAAPEVAPYPFTTQAPAPGMLQFENIQIQIVDTPPLSSEEPPPWLHNLLRNADLLLLVVDLSQEPTAQLESILEGLRRVRVKPAGLGEDTEAVILPKRALIIGSKSDLDGASEGYRLVSQYDADLPVVSVSAEAGLGLEELRQEVYRALDIIRVYTKAPGKKPELTEPVVLPRGSTLADAAESVHKDFRAKLKYALVWGSGKFDGQRVGRDHVLEEGDIIELHI